MLWSKLPLHLLGQFGQTVDLGGMVLRRLSNADSVARNPEDGLMYFVKPLEVDEPFPAFLHYVREQEKGIHGATNVKYAQSRELYMIALSHLQLLIPVEFRE